MTTINPDDAEFIRNHTVYFEQARLDFLHGLQPHVRNRFEMIYKFYIDRNFVLTTWCSACVVDMMQRLADFWDANKPAEMQPEPVASIEITETPQPEPKRGRGRPRKS